ncbi:energy-coupling factor transporter transmembrane component T [Qiania dongpingensis]|uniref:Energy-coupling factor transporter transmembrane protein EcfT n=1 Tax=Qiania dongpingensis TaxID=2763669 RepID=A0A7G9G4H7_9FIRM|nr:energy-coupling factor transporter transmembrane component T [Qiania dongpingensis]QNM05709.1 energy-coupling factor transporter transmembrane protein EcfT [Qiania dongpingensis]
MDTFEGYHPVVNFTYFLMVLLITMFSMHPLFLAMTFLVSFLYSFMLEGGKAVKRNLCFLIPIVLLAVLLNPLFTQRGQTILFYLNDAAVTMEAVAFGVAAAIMFTSMIIWFSCFSCVMNTDKFIYLFGRIIPSVGLVLSMCFRFIPLLKRRFREIAQGQKYLGRNFTGQKLFRRVRQLGKEISILIAWSLEAGIETSDSMEARGYGLKGRSSYSIFRFDRRDAFMLTSIAALSGIVIYGCFQKVNSILYYPRIVFREVTALSAVVYIAYGILLLLPIYIELQGEIKWKHLYSKM